MATDNSKQRLIAIAAVVIALLLGVNIFLLINKTKQDAKNKELTTQVSEAEQEKLELEKVYYEALSDLEEMKGSNEELNALIEEQKTQLEEQKNRVDRLLRDSGSLKQARSEIQKLRNQASEYLAEITQLKEENEELRGQTQVLSMKADSLRETLQSKSLENQELSTAKAALASEKESLAMENTTLAKKVDIASVVKVQNISGVGYKTRNNGKLADKKRANNVDHLKVCFDATANRIAVAGDEMFYVRVINPTGETLAIEDLGSGVMKSKATGEQIRFTKSTEIAYSQEEENLCVSWIPNQPFQAGKYTVEVYNKGYLAGSSTFELK